MKTTTVSDAQTRAVARRLASLLRPNDVLLLCGPLGSGKTAFVAGLAEGLGIDDPVTSPSFVIAHRYDGGFIPLVHADVYRVQETFREAYAARCFDPDYPEPGDGGFPVDP